MGTDPVSATVSQIDHYVRFTLNGSIAVDSATFDLTDGAVALQRSQTDPPKIFSTIRIAGHRRSGRRAAKPAGPPVEIHGAVWADLAGATLSPLGALHADLLEMALDAVPEYHGIEPNDRWLLDARVSNGIPAHPYRQDGWLYWITEDGLMCCDGNVETCVSPQLVNPDDVGGAAGYARLMMRVARSTIAPAIG